MGVKEAPCLVTVTRYVYMTVAPSRETRLCRKPWPSMNHPRNSCREHDVPARASRSDSTRTVDPSKRRRTNQLLNQSVPKIGRSEGWAMSIMIHPYHRVLDAASLMDSLVRKDNPRYGPDPSGGRVIGLSSRVPCTSLGSPKADSKNANTRSGPTSSVASSPVGWY